MEIFNDLHHPEYIPGTFNIYSSTELESDDYNQSFNDIKRDRSGVVLIPQPSDSPNDPLNWSKCRKILHFALMSFITAFTAATSNGTGAAADSLHDYYNITYDSLNAGAGVLFFGIGWATLIFAPLPSLYGRRLTYFICIFLGLCGALWFARTSKTRDVIWSQLFVGISESCAEAHVQLSLTDIFFQHQLGSVLTVYIMSISVGTFLGPLIGRYIATLANFRWLGWCAAIMSGALLVWIYFGCEETYFDRHLYMTPYSKHSIINKSVDELPTSVDEGEDATSNKDGPITATGQTISTEKCITFDKELINGSKEPLKKYHKRIKLITKATNLKGWGVKQYFRYLGTNLRMFLFPPVWLSGLFWGIQDVFLSFYLTTQDTYFYDEPWNYSAYSVALMNVPTLAGAVIGCMYAGVISDVFVLWMARRNRGILEAEYRLYFSGAAAALGSSGLMMFGIGAENALPPPVIYVGLGFIGFAWGCSGDIAMAYLMDCYPEMVLEGMACTSVINNTLSCVFTFCCSQWLESFGTKNTYIILGLINLAITFLAVPMLIFGKRIRAWTKDWYTQSVELRESVRRT
ncbi:Hol1p Ecym_5082 [Eremothecium cymbalariae DBVPG|uniref:Major facilitator superfamily (MFS) profile domain-containing protein n=1 Tax=Eremothecium cymbalariae (strain CBS 270.75 / DBVPG 7215 / KCTC 17166 / NRRL Y-17582) TaxID=931890 RepID=I6NCS9_ERECY|nr:hypothetical protein Ecym_5082 [Eremothecium cymbalariae DBVPG\